MEYHQSERTSHELSRRELLKVLSAAGLSTAAATLLPGRWLEPEILSGVLPAHAQSSAIDLLNLRDGPVWCFEGQPRRFDYYDPLGSTVLVNDIGLLVTYYLRCGSRIDHQQEFSRGVLSLIVVDDFNGSIDICVDLPTIILCAGVMFEQVILKASDGREALVSRILS